MGKEILVKAEFSKAEIPISVTEFGIVTEVTFVVFAKMPLGILVSPFSKVIFERPDPSNTAPVEKAEGPLVKVLGIVIEVKLVQFLNVAKEILSRLPKFTCDKFVQSSKAL